MKTIEQLWREIVNDKELTQKLSEAYDNESVDSFLSANQVDGTKEQFRKYCIDKRRQFSGAS